MSSYSGLRESIGDALRTAYAASIGIDCIANGGERNIAHIFTSVPWPPETLLSQLRDLTGGALGAASRGPDEWGVITLGQLSATWEDEFRGASLKGYVLQLAAAWEAYTKHEVNEPFPDFMERHGDQGRRVTELRATRNCLMHADGVADEDYLGVAAGEARVGTVGEALPFDWSYAFDRTIDVLAIAERHNG